MAGFTNHYGLQTLDSGDSFSLNGQKYTDSDRIEIDRLLYIGAQAHVHTGQAPSTVTPTTVGTATTTAGGGSYTSGTTVYYEYTYVDATGAETLPSPILAVTLPGGLTVPAPPTLIATIGTGSLPAGDYYYAISAWTGVNTNETVTAAPVYVYLSGTGEITIDFPTSPTGADGFNIYRLSPNNLNYLYLDSVTGTGSDVTYVDDGTVSTSCNRSLPTGNNSGGTYSITFALPAAPPTGFTWNLYETLTVGSWTDTLLANVTSGATTYTDVGAGTSDGTPPLTSELIGTPGQIDLASEVQGVLPASSLPVIPAEQLGGVPEIITFAFPGPLTAQTGTSVWTNEYDSAQVISVRASLGRGASPAAQPVEVDVLLATSQATPTYTSIFPTGGYPQVPVGSQIGAALTPPDPVVLSPGDSLGVDLVQAGGGATPTDHDLTINIYVLGTVGATVEEGEGVSSIYVDSSAGGSGSFASSAQVVLTDDIAPPDYLFVSAVSSSTETYDYPTISDDTFGVIYQETGTTEASTYLTVTVWGRAANDSDAGATFTVTGNDNVTVDQVDAVAYTASGVDSVNGLSIAADTSFDYLGPTLTTANPNETIVNFIVALNDAGFDLEWDGTVRQSVLDASQTLFVIEDSLQPLAGSYSGATATASNDSGDAPLWVGVAVALLP